MSASDFTRARRQLVPVVVLALATSAFACRPVDAPLDPARAYRAGYRAGARAGRQDAQHHVWANPQRLQAYREAIDGYDRRRESRAKYREQFRSGFLDGYGDAYRAVSSPRAGIK